MSNDPLQYIKDLYNRGEPFVEELRTFVRKYPNDMIWIKEHEQDPWWLLMLRFVNYSSRYTDLKYACSLYDEQHPYINLIIEIINQAQSSLSTRRQDHQEMWDNFIDFVKTTDCPMLAQKNDIVKCFKGDGFTFKEEHFSHFHLPERFHILFPYLTPSDWMNFFEWVIKDIQLKKAGPCWTQYTGGWNDMGTYLSYVSIYEEELALRAWQDDDGRFRVLYYTLHHKALPAKQSDATKFLKTVLYEKYGVSFNQRSRIETLIPPTSDDNKALIQKTLRDAMRNPNPEYTSETELVI